MNNSEDLALSANPAFHFLPLKEELLTNLSSLQFDSMTPIQAQSLPIMLQGSDIIAQAKTGSGKTAAFGLALLNHLLVEQYAVQALILCPTRELAEQISQALRRFARLLPNVKVLTLSGGIPMKPQLDSLKHGAHIIVGTPGRVQKHLSKETLSLQHLKTLVLDEADRMLDMGFFTAIKEVISFTPKSRQTLLFSATYPPLIQELANEFLNTPKQVIIEETETNFDIEQRFYEVPNQAGKFSLLKTLLLQHQSASTLIFCNTKEQTVSVASLLTQEGFNARALNGDMEQVARDQAMICFTNQSCSILVATDVAARGLDIQELPLVINYELAFEYDVHIHRIGRTGRAGNKGIALSITTPADAQRALMIEHYLMKPLAWGNSNDLKSANTAISPPPMKTLSLTAGKKDKIRAGDILGALTKEAGLAGEMIGKIHISTQVSYVAINRTQADKAYLHFQTGKLKGRKISVKRL